jgi:hypothetical protein
MKYTLELLKADLTDELAKLERLAQDFSRIDPMLEQSSAEVSSYDRAAIGYYLHSFYNFTFSEFSCKNLFIVGHHSLLCGDLKEGGEFLCKFLKVRLWREL